MSKRIKIILIISASVLGIIFSTIYFVDFNKNNNNAKQNTATSTVTKTPTIDEIIKTKYFPHITNDDIVSFYDAEQGIITTYSQKNDKIKWEIQIEKTEGLAQFISDDQGIYLIQYKYGYPALGCEGDPNLAEEEVELEECMDHLSKEINQYEQIKSNKIIKIEINTGNILWQRYFFDKTFGFDSIKFTLLPNEIYIEARDDYGTEYKITVDKETGKVKSTEKIPRPTE